MNCVMCGDSVHEVRHIALTDEGEPVVMCDACYKKAEPFFKEVSFHGKNEPGRCDERGE